MPSKERQELIETIAQKMQEKWSGGHINWDRLHGQLKKDYLDIAEVAADTIRAALKEPDQSMLGAASDYSLNTFTVCGAGYWRVMLAASALGEQSDGI